MPVLAILALEFHATNRLVQLVKESKLGAHAKVRDS